MISFPITTRSWLRAAGVCAFGMLLTSSTLTAFSLIERGHPTSSHHDPSFARFEHQIIPLLERRCTTGSDCHALPELRYRELMADAQHQGAFYAPVDPQTGAISRNPALRQLLFDVVRGAQQDHHEGRPARIDYQAPAELSPPLRTPLHEVFGGLPHAGRQIFDSPDDPAYLALRGWVQQEIDQHPEPAAQRGPAQSFFDERVVGVLEQNGCFVQSCHGAYVFNDLKLVQPLPSPGLRAGERVSRLSPSMLRALRSAVLGTVTRFVDLGGDLTQSRLVRKNLPIHEGGIHQRGGNVQFFESLSDPDVHTLLEWMRLERAELAAQLTSGGESVPEAELGRERAVAFLRGPRHAPRQFFDFAPFWPGTRLLALREGDAAPIALVDEPGVEIQSFDVRYDARAIVLSLRRSADTGFRLYELALDADARPVPHSLRQRSFGPDRDAAGELIHHIDPIYSPEPSPAADPALEHALDRVAVTFASNAAGAFSASQPFAFIGEADGGEPQRLVDAQRTERPGTYDGQRLSVIAGPMAGQWRTITAHRAGGSLVLDRPLPQAPDRRTLYTIETQTAGYQPSFDIWQMLPAAGWDSARRMTWSNAQERRPSVRTSGETMFTSLRNRGYQLDRPVYNGAIYRVQAGGFDYHIHGGNRSRYPLYADSRELPSGLEVRVVLDPRNHWGGGALLLADHGLGVDIEPDNPMDDVAHGAGSQLTQTASQRFVRSQLPLFPEVGRDAITHTGLSPAGAFRDPQPQPDGSLLVAHTPTQLDHLDANADPDWDLYRVRFAAGVVHTPDGSRAAQPELTRITAASSAQWAEYAPRSIQVRLKERARTHQKFAARSDGLQPRADHGVLRYPPDTPAEIECYDFPLLQAFLGTFAPVGARDFAEPRLRYVRIVQQLPRTREDSETLRDADPFATRVGLGVHDRQRIIAEVPLEADGSFYAQVPPNVPLIMQALDAERMAISSVNRWFYLQPGEKLTFSIPRSIFTTRCSGCHGALTGDSGDAVGPPDVVSAASLVMATWDPEARARREPFRTAPLSIDFRHDVQPILTRHCVQCHDAGGPAPDLRDAPAPPFTVAYRALHALRDPRSGNPADKRYVNEREALSSESDLITRLSGRASGAPHPHGDPLDASELLTLIRWIDLGATFLGDVP